MGLCHTSHDVQEYTGFHTYREDKTGGGVSVFIRNCYTSTDMADFSVCHEYYKISVGFVFKQLYHNYYRCFQTTRQTKNPLVYNQIE